MATILPQYRPDDASIKVTKHDAQEIVRKERRKSKTISEKAAAIGSVESLRQGKLPNNVQLNKSIDRLLTSRSIKNNMRFMSPDGQLLLNDFKELLILFQRALKDKNREELFQSMIYHAKRSEEAYRRDHTDDLKQGFTSGANDILKITKLILFNVEFRNLLEQILALARDTMGLDFEKITNQTKEHEDDVDSILEQIQDEYYISSDGNVRKSILLSFPDRTRRNSLLSNTFDYNDDSSINSNETEDDNVNLPRSYHQFLSNRFSEPEPLFITTDDAGHTLNDDLLHGAVQYKQTVNRVSNSFLTNISATNPSAQMSESDLRRALAASRIDRGYVNLYSLNPAAQVSDTNLRMALASSRGQHIEPAVSPLEIYKHPLESNIRASSTSSFIDSGIVDNEQDQELIHETFDQSQIEDIPNIRSISPSSFIDTGVIGNNEENQVEFKHETFIGNHMDVYEIKNPTTAVTEKIVLSPHTNIGVGAGYDLIPHDLTAEQVIQNLRQKSLYMTQEKNYLLDTNNKRFSDSTLLDQLNQKMDILPLLHDEGFENLDEDEHEQHQWVPSSDIISKLKEIISSLQKKPEFQQALSTLFSLFDVWSQKLRTGHGGMDRRPSSIVGIPEQSEYYKNVATFEAKTIIEDWTCGKSLDPILQQFYNLAVKFKQDNKARQLYEKVLIYLKKLLEEPGYFDTEKSTKDGEKILTELRSPIIEEYKPQSRNLVIQSIEIIQAISKDKTSNDISKKLKDIHNHLWFDRYGQVSWKPHLINDLRITLLPALIEQIKFVPLPQILYSDKQYDLAIENIVLEGETLMPDVFEIRADDFIRFSPKMDSSYSNSQGVNVHLSGIRTTINDVIFYYKIKSGFPKMSDSGVVSLTTGGSGLRISLRVTSNSSDQYHSFKVEQCHCHIDKLEIKVKSCKHNMMYKVFNSMLTGIVKRQICKTIENRLVSLIESSDERVTKHLRYKQLLNEDGSKASNIGRPGLISHLISIFNEKII